MGGEGGRRLDSAFFWRVGSGHWTATKKDKDGEEKWEKSEMTTLLKLPLRKGCRDLMSFPHCLRKGQLF